MGGVVLVSVLALCLTIIVVGTDALTCLQGGCSAVRCDPAITEQSCVGGQFRRKGSICGCCDICIPYVGESQQCKPKLYRPGFPPDVVCRPPLQCVDGYCKKQ